jgi:hypothetical protein
MEDFRDRLRLGKYTSWAHDLGEDEIEAVLWVVGEYGYRAGLFEGMLDRCIPGDDHRPMDEVGYARVRLALALLDEMVHGGRFTVEQVKSRVRDGLRRSRDGTGLPEQGDA